MNHKWHNYCRIELSLFVSVECLLLTLLPANAAKEIPQRTTPCEQFVFTGKSVIYTDQSHCLAAIPNKQNSTFDPTTVA